MKNIYVSHSKEFNYQDELYNLIRNSELNTLFNIILPHETNTEQFNSKDFLKNECYVFVIEASYPTIGSGIEAGWANAYEIPIITIYKKGFKLKGSIKSISTEVIEYSSYDDLIIKLKDVLERI